MWTAEESTDVEVDDRSARLRFTAWLRPLGMVQWVRYAVHEDIGQAERVLLASIHEEGDMLLTDGMYPLDCERWIDRMRRVYPARTIRRRTGKAAQARRHTGVTW